MALTHSETILGVFIRHAPNDPFWTRLEGHPIFKLIFEYP
tara:strand:+ start:544 stop:663 length:120 start_codon:yes stop_codon:yes gene_type:complete